MRMHATNVRCSGRGSAVRRQRRTIEHVWWSAGARDVEDLIRRRIGDEGADGDGRKWLGGAREDCDSVVGNGEPKVEAARALRAARSTGRIPVVVMFTVGRQASLGRLTRDVACQPLHAAR